MLVFDDEARSRRKIHFFNYETPFMLGIIGHASSLNL
jgi:hypothetical protein